ncbi:MAG: helix-turn-helix domain-containing protein [Rickettsiales bacterium]
MRYNPTDAAKLLSGVTRKTLYGMMKNGDISFAVEGGKRYIDGAELARAFGEKFRPEKAGQEGETFQNVPQKHFETFPKQTETAETFLENALLKQQVEALQERLRDKDAENARLWKKLDDEAEERRKITAVLADQRGETGRKKRGVWAWLIGKGD